MSRSCGAVRKYRRTIPSRYLISLSSIDTSFCAPAIGDIGGADQREIVLIGIDEDNAAIVVLQQISMKSGPEFQHHHVASLTSRTLWVEFNPATPCTYVLDPGSSRVLTSARASREMHAAILTPHFDQPFAVYPARA